MKTLLIITLSSIGMLTETPEIIAGCLIFVFLILAVKPSNKLN